MCDPHGFSGFARVRGLGAGLRALSPPLRPLDESRQEVELAIKSYLALNDEEGAEQTRLYLAKLDITGNQAQTAAVALRKSLIYFKSKNDEVTEIEIRALPIEALLAMPSSDSKGEIASQARVPPNTQNASLRLASNIQIARARFALGERARAAELLADVISESHRMGYESLWLEARLARAEIDLQFGDSSAGHRQIDQIAEQAQAKGLILIANKARSLAKG